MEGKNLFDIGDTIKKEIRFIQTKEGCTIKTAEMNKFTIDFLKSKGIYGIKNIPIIQNNNLMNYEIKFNREKNSKPTEYVPYKELEESIKLLEEKIEKGKELDTRNNPMSDIIDEIIIENKAIDRLIKYIKEESIPKAVVEDKEEKIKMIEKNKKLLQEKKGICQQCGKYGYTEKHHIKTKGSGGDDIKENLIEVCRTCHRLIHNGKTKPEKKY